MSDDGFTLPMKIAFGVLGLIVLGALAFSLLSIVMTIREQGAVGWIMLGVLVATLGSLVVLVVEVERGR